MRYFLLAIPVLLIACGSQDTPSDRSGGDAASGGDTLSGGDRDGPWAAHDLTIEVEGQTTAHTFTDGLSGQTPQNYYMGLGGFELMTSATDPAPVSVFDHGGSYEEVDMLTTSVAGSARLIDLPPGTYTHGRVLLHTVRFAVDTTFHATTVTLNYPTQVNVIAALSDTTIGTQAHDQGWVQYSVTVPILGDVSIPGTLPALPSTAGGAMVQSGGQTWLIFPFPEPIVVASIPTGPITATIVYDVFESFRWEELAASGFATGVFDTSEDGTFEPVHNFGANDYSIVIQ